MESEPNRAFGIGVIRVSDAQWKQSSEAIKTNLNDGEIVNVVQAMSNGSYYAAKDIVIRHPELEAVKDGDVIPRYFVEFFPNPDGTVTRGPFISDKVK